MKISELPFCERPVRELLNLVEVRETPSHDYAGYGWATAPRVWLITAAGDRLAVDDALVLAVHTADDAPAIVDDLQLEFELPNHPPVAVMATRFLDTWTPRLPRTSAVVLCVCNPHAARLAKPRPMSVPFHVPAGDVHSWFDHDAREILLTADSWSST